MRSKQTKELKRNAIRLARRGFTDQQIYRAVGISKQTFYSQNYADLVDTIRDQREALKDKVMIDLIRQSSGDTGTQATKYLAEKLKVFKPYYRTAKPKSASEATERISQIYSDVVGGELEAERGRYLVGFLNDYIKGFEASELERRLDEIETELNARKRKR